MAQAITRRNLIAGTAAASLAGAAVIETGLASRAHADEADTADWDYEADVIVVGTGPAGLAAAANAAEGGASVIAIDSNDKIGGRGIISGGMLGIGGGTRLQIEAGYEESADIIYEDRTLYNLRDDMEMTVSDVDGGEHTMGMWRRISGAEDGPGMARAYADRSLDTWNWLDEIGAPFNAANVSGMSFMFMGTRYYTTTTAQPVDRDNPDGMTAGGAGIMWAMYDDAVDHGAEFILNCKMTSIIRADGPQAGRVLGIEADLDGTPVRMKANNGVFLGSGSWVGSDKLKVLFSPMLLKYPHISGEPYVWNDGSGVEIALAAGAAMTTDRGCDWHGWHRHLGSHWHNIKPPYGVTGASSPDADKCIFVNAEGERFMNEEISEDGPAWVGGNPPFFFAQICANQTANDDGPIVWCVMDEPARDTQSLDFTVGETIEPEMYATGDTIEELAENMGVPADALAATIESYNAMVDGGTDTEFGKSSLTAKIETAPFHAVMWGIQKHNTMGGVMIDPDARVLDWSANVIEGLYAAGEVAGNMDLNGLAKPIVFGRIAGENLAKA